MSLYLDSKNTSPHTTQYGSHFVMTDVHKPIKTKILNIDTRFCDTFSASTPVANYNVTLPERISEIKSMRVTNIEIPIGYYNISQNNGNNSFTMTIGEGSAIVYSIPDGQYDANTIIPDISNVLPSQITFNLLSSTNQFPSVAITNLSNTESVTFNFAKGTSSLPFNLGWILGFRNSCYTLPPLQTLYATSPLNLDGPRYLYLAVDTFQNDNPHSFISTIKTSELTQNILGRISMNPQKYPFGSIYPANIEKGNLLTDKRIYTTRVNIQRMNIQLINEIGIPLDINQLDFSFSLELEYV